MYNIRIAGEPHQVSTVRIFGAAVARQFGCAPDDIEDLKIALSEACGQAIEPEGATPVTVSVRPGSSELAFLVERDRPPESRPVDPDAADLSRELITALFPRAEITSVGSKTRFRFAIPSPPATV